MIQTFSPSAETVDENPAADERLMSGKPKTCCNCGRDLTGHRRFKDSVGYWCKDCHRADKARAKVHETKCPGARHFLDIGMLGEVDDDLPILRPEHRMREVDREVELEPVKRIESRPFVAVAHFDGFDNAELCAPTVAAAMTFLAALAECLA